MNPNLIKSYEDADVRLSEAREEETRKRLLAKLAQELVESEGDPVETEKEYLDPIDLAEEEDLIEIDDSNDIVLETKLNERDRKATEEMRNLIWHNYAESGREYFELEKTISKNRLLLDVIIRKQERMNASENKISTRTQATDLRRDKIDEAKKNLKKLEEASPESYVVVKGLEFRNHVKEIKEGKVVATPYVREHLDEVKRNISKGRPTFLHGHLGSGKTEIAITAAKEASIERVAFETAEKECLTYIRKNPDVEKSERLDMLSRFYRKNLETFDKALRDGDKAAVDEFAPLIISGSKDLTSQDLFSDKTLKLAKFNGKPLLEHKKELDAEIQTWRDENPEDANDPEKARREADKILELYKLKNQAFGTEVEVVKQAIYRGVEEGRPVIIDEINAIPAAVLISLNDILQRRPGETCYIPGAGQVKIEPGFSIIMTGNLDQGNVSYFGTEELNPAFLSRLDSIEHDYLPMSETDRNYKDQADPSKNELFQVVLAYLADRQGNLELPEMEESLQKLFALSQLSHVTGLIFGGKWRESESNSLETSSGDEVVEPQLEKSVLSIRNLIHVLEEWNKGSEKDLDKALWDGFISTITNPDDQNLVLGLAKRYGFFQKEDGWQIEMKERGSGITSLREAYPGYPESYNYKSEEMDVYSVHKVIEVLYGPGPKREIYPDSNILDEVMELVDDEVGLEDLAGFEQKLNIIKSSVRALEVLGEQCGCPNIEQE